MSGTDRTDPAGTTGAKDGAGGTQGSWLLMQVTAPVFFVAGVVQILLGGYGVFATDGGSLADSSHLDVHRALGNALAALALLLFVGTILTRSRKYMIGGAVVLVLTGVAGVLASSGTDTPALGALHVLDAFVLVGASGWLAHGAFRGAR